MEQSYGKRFGYYCLAVVLVSIGLLMVAGCEEKEVPYVKDTEILERYIYETEEGRDLFRTDNLFLEDEYTIPFDSAVYKTIVDSTHRDIELEIFVDTAKYDSLRHFWYRTTHEYSYPVLNGTYWDAEAIIDDRFFVRTLRIFGSDTTETAEERVVTRYGFFVKIGSDNRPYLGWRLWGFNGGAPNSPGQMEVRSEDGAVFRGDNLGYDNFRYIIHWENYSTGDTTTQAGGSNHIYLRTDELGVIEDGSWLYLNSSYVRNQSYYQTVSAATDGGFRLQMMNRSDSSHYVDTVKTPDNNPRIWNLLFFQEWQRYNIPGNPPPDTIGTNWYGWCVPYRVPQ
ncbi:MAG: hypothetical protein KOO62_12870 [candidate division Zixibacteria bacterium]|nr:hypothetical protein [candidate division Zixibacteria bacterium]